MVGPETGEGLSREEPRDYRIPETFRAVQARINQLQRRVIVEQGGRPRTSQINELLELRGKRADLSQAAGIGPALMGAEAILDDVCWEAVETSEGSWTQAAEYVKGKRGEVVDEVMEQADPLVEQRVREGRFDRVKHEGIGSWYTQRALDRMEATFRQRAGEDLTLDIQRNWRLISADRWAEEYEWKVPEVVMPAQSTEPQAVSVSPEDALVGEGGGDVGEGGAGGPGGPRGPGGSEPPVSPDEPGREPESITEVLRELAREQRRTTEVVGRLAESQREFIATSRDLVNELRSFLGNFREDFRSTLASVAGMAAGTREERERISEGLAREQTEALIAAGRRLSPEEERAMYVELMYDGELYARFQLGLEPGWYKALAREQRGLENSKLQLARAVYYKSTFAGQAEKLLENPDIYLSMEQMESLYKVPGVRPAMEWYVAAMVNKTTFDVGGPRGKTVWEMSTYDEWERVREQMRRVVLGEIVPADREHTAEERRTLLRNMETDAVAWNFIYITNLAESLDTRYSPYGSGRRHGALIIASDDLKATFHPQEKWVSKFGNTSEPQSWGKFGRWGLAQFNRIKDEVGFSRATARNYDFRFEPARRVGDFWRHDQRLDGGKRLVTVYVPECYPTTTVKSFLEETTDREGRTLFDYLREGREITNWSERFGGSTPWSASYQVVKLPNAIKLGDYFTSTKVGVLEMGKINYETIAEWADPERGIEAALTRLSLGELPGRPSDGEPRLSHDEFHNLKVWAVFAGVGWRVGGVKDVSERKPEMAVGEQEKQILRMNLRDESIKYLKGRGGLFSWSSWAGEDLDIKDLH